MALNTNLAAKKAAPEATPAEETAKVNAAAQASAAPVDEALGSKSGTIEFIAPLGDPSKDDVTQVGDQKIVTPTIVGYRFRALVDMEVPECGTDSDLKSNPMSFKNIDGKKAVKAGETFDLTRFETGLLLSPAEFNGRVTGGQHEMVAAYTSTAVKNSSGQVMKADAVAKIPTVSLRAAAQGASIKDFKMINVLTFTKEKGENGVSIVHREIVPGFEKWLPLTERTARKSGSATPSTPKVTRNKGAEAFLRIVKSKR